MLASIDFDDQTSFSACEIDDVRTERLLTNEFVTTESTGAQPIPEACLGGS